MMRHHGDQLEQREAALASRRMPPHHSLYFVPSRALPRLFE